MSASPPHRLFLLDGMALVYRAHFAFMVRPIVNSKGMNTSAVYGFTNTLVELLKSQQPTHLAVVFDTAAPTPRHAEFPAYKAQREAMPEDLSIAIPFVKRLLGTFNIPVLELDGFEADDIIGTLARQAEAHGDFVTYMVTPDKDFAQLVDERTLIYKPGRQGSEHEIIDAAKVKEMWLVSDPVQVIDVLALWGDVSDNIPGVPGIGEKTAKTLIQKFGTVENLLGRIDELKGKQKENVAAYAEQLRLCKRLTSIITDVPLSVTVEDLALQKMNDAAVMELFVELEFNQLGRRLFGNEFKAGRGFQPAEGAATAVDLPVDSSQDELGLEAPPASPPPVYVEVPTTYVVAPLDELSRHATGPFAVAVDWDGANPQSARLRGIALSSEAGKVSYFNWSEKLAAELPGLLNKEGVVKIGFDLKSQLRALMANGVAFDGGWSDLYLAQLLTEPDQKSSLSYLSESLLGYHFKKYDKEGEANSTQDMFVLEDDSEARIKRGQAMERADICWRLHPLVMDRVEKSGQAKVYHSIEMPLLPVLVRMEHTGIKLDLLSLREIGNKLDLQVRDLENSIQELAGQPFNLNSPKQLGQILFEKLKLVEKPKKTKTGQYTTGEEVLQELAGLHPIVNQLLEYREASKLKSTYVDALPLSVSPKTGRVHTSYLQLSTATGRMASINPNLQNIPIRSEQGREIRRAFVAGEPGWMLVAADYSQIELRVMAELSGDEAMKQAFLDGLDIHTATAAKVFGVEPDMVTPGMRRTSKMVNFGIIYGISAFGLSQRLGMPRAECQRLIDEYFVQYPKVKEFMDNTILEAKASGHVDTLTGRRRHMRDIASANATIRKGAERMAINSPIQGTAADMIKLAMVKVDQEIKDSGMEARLLLQVHDELVFEAPISEVDRLKEIARSSMQNAMKLTIPIQVDFGSAPNWKDAHP